MQISIIITGIVVALIAGLFLISRRMVKNIPIVEDHKNILTLTDKNFQHQTTNKLVLVDFWASWCAPCRIMAPVLNEVADELAGDSHVGKVNIEQFQSLAQKFRVRSIPTLILVDFHALWCSPCKMQSPILKEVASELGERVRVIKIDVDSNSQIAGRYSVQSVPTIIIFKNGRVIWRQSGVVSKNQLKSVLLQNA